MATTPTPPVQANGAPPPLAAAEPPKEDPKALRAKLAEVAENEKRKHAARLQERQRLEAAERAQQAAIARAEAAEARQKEIEAELSDPIAFAKRRGISARDLGERIVKEGSTEEQLAEAIARAKEADRKTEALRQELAAREQRAHAERSQLQSRRALIDTVEQGKAQMPILARLGPDKMIGEYLRTWNEVLAHPETGQLARQGAYTDAELLAATEARLLNEIRERLDFDVLDIEELEKHLTRRKGSASVQDKAETASGTQDKKAVSTGRTGKTLSSALQQGSSGSWKPDNWDKLSDKKQNEILIARIKSGQPID